MFCWFPADGSQSYFPLNSESNLLQTNLPVLYIQSFSTTHLDSIHIKIVLFLDLYTVNFISLITRNFYYLYYLWYLAYVVSCIFFHIPYVYMAICSIRWGSTCILEILRTCVWEVGGSSAGYIISPDFNTSLILVLPNPKATQHHL